MCRLMRMDGRFDRSSSAICAWIHDEALPSPLSGEVCTILCVHDKVNVDALVLSVRPQLTAPGGTPSKPPQQKGCPVGQVHLQLDRRRSCGQCEVWCPAVCPETLCRMVIPTACSCWRCSSPLRPQPPTRSTTALVAQPADLQRDLQKHRGRPRSRHSRYPPRLLSQVLHNAVSHVRRLAPKGSPSLWFKLFIVRL